MAESEPTPDPIEPFPTPSLMKRLRILLFGAPRDFRDPRIFHKISLIAFLAWIGLGVDGLSSSAYGPDECFRALGEQGNFTFLAVLLAVAMALTVVIIASAYSGVIEEFPTGGGGYLVATKLLGRHAGLVSGSALIVDYILTITVSIASGGDALFSMLPLSVHYLKVPTELSLLLLLLVLNLRGIKESVTAMMPIFLVFVVTHLILIVGGMVSHAGRAPAVAEQVVGGFREATSSIGLWGLLLIFLSAYSRGAGTYTGIEAVSNGLQIMRQPVVQTGKRTMVYMAASLSFTAGGILICYLLFGVQPQEGKTMNSVLVDAFAGSWQLFGIPVGSAFVWLTILSEGAVLFVAAQTGFIGGPRTMANMAVDSWLPRRFASLSDRLTTKDGVLLMGGAAIALLLTTSGSVSTLVVMYAINVFVTFSLTTLGMCRLYWKTRSERTDWHWRFFIQAVGFLLSLAILVVMVLEKFTEGAWLTIVITSGCVALCIAVRMHYRSISNRLSSLDKEFEDLPLLDHQGGEPDPKEPTAVLMVGSYGGVGIHSLLSIQRTFPGYFKNIVFVSVAVIDTGSFKGVKEFDHLREIVDEHLAKYVMLARKLGWKATARSASGIDGVAELTRLCIDIARVYQHAMFFAGKLLWKRENWFQRLLHNETAFQVQRRLQWKGLPMTVLPLRIIDREAPTGI